MFGQRQATLISYKLLTSIQGKMRPCFSSGFQPWQIDKLSKKSTTSIFLDMILLNNLSNKRTKGASSLLHPLTSLMRIVSSREQSFCRVLSRPGPMGGMGGVTPPPQVFFTTFCRQKLYFSWQSAQLKHNFCLLKVVLLKFSRNQKKHQHSQCWPSRLPIRAIKTR